jgi:hypothetical protein
VTENRLVPELCIGSVERWRAGAGTNDSPNCRPVYARSDPKSVHEDARPRMLPGPRATRSAGRVFVTDPPSGTKRLTCGRNGLD